MDTARTPSVIHIIRADSLSTSLAMVPLMLWLLFGAVYILPPVLNGQPVQVDPWQLLMLVFATLFCCLALAWRVLTIQEILSKGVALYGHVTKVWFFGGRGRVTYYYTYAGIEYTPSVPFVKNKVTERLAVGSQVALVIDPQNPKRALLRDAFGKN